MCLRIVIPQLNFKQGAIEYNLSKMLDAIAKNYEGKCLELYVFPELTLVGYQARDLIYYSARSLDSELISKVIDFISDYPKAYVAFGFPEIDAEIKGVLYNSYVIVSKDGVIGHWRKTHLPTFTVFEEDRYFRENTKLYPPAEIGEFKVGATICYDAFYSELVRAQVLLGADIILVPSGSPLQSMKLWEPILKSRAIENTVFVVYSNHTGYKDGLLFFGKSRIVDPLGNVIIEAKLGEEDIIEYKIRRYDLLYARRVRPTLRDFRSTDIENLVKAYKMSKL